jgi:hypothetical protein
MLIALPAVLGVDPIVVVVVVGGARIEVAAAAGRRERALGPLTEAAASDPGGRCHAG